MGTIMRVFINSPVLDNQKCCHGGGKIVVFNATSNNISIISWRPVLLVEKTGAPGGNHVDKLYKIMLY